MWLEILFLINWIFLFVEIALITAIFFSLLGINVGIREKYRDLLLFIFNWILRCENSEQTDEKSPERSIERESSAESTFSIRKKRNASSEQLVLVRRWSSSVDGKVDLGRSKNLNYVNFDVNKDNLDMGDHIHFSLDNKFNNHEQEVENAFYDNTGSHPNELLLVRHGSKKLRPFRGKLNAGNENVSISTQSKADNNCIHSSAVDNCQNLSFSIPDNEKEIGNAYVDPELATLAFYLIRGLKVIADDTMEWILAGIEVIIQDDVTCRFEASQLASWNFLSRSKVAFGMKIGWLSWLVWFVGVFFRYGVLFPFRFVLFMLFLGTFIIFTPLVGYISNKELKRQLYRYTILACMNLAARSFTAIIRFHKCENRPKYGIVVANHTSPTDAIILSTDNVYDMVGQRHGGLLGFMQKILGNSSHHIWFERAEKLERRLVLNRYREHVDNPDRLPLLIFPEGTCINNTSVMLFKKGAFEVSNIVYPIAMKYDNVLGDAFWNSHERNFLTYFVGMMTSWAIVCDITYLPAFHRREQESSIEFARRCQRYIAREGGLVDLGWDGNLKRSRVPDKLKDEQRALYMEYLVKTTPICECGRPNAQQIQTIEKEIHPEVFDSENLDVCVVSEDEKLASDKTFT